MEKMSVYSHVTSIYYKHEKDIYNNLQDRQYIYQGQMHLKHSFARSQFSVKVYINGIQCLSQFHELAFIDCVQS